MNRDASVTGMPVSRGRKAKSSRPKGRRGGRPEAGPGTLVMRELAALHPAVDPLSAEHVVSEVFGIVYGSQEIDKQDIVDTLAADLLEDAERATETGRPGSRELLAVLAHLAPEHLRERAAAMLDLARARLTDDGSEETYVEPAWMAGLEQTQATGTWAMSDAYGDVTEYIATFGYGPDAPFGPDHALIWMVHNTMGPIASDCLVGREAAKVLAEIETFCSDPDNVDDVSFAAIDPALLHAHVLGAMDVETASEGAPVYDTYASNRAIAFARLAVLPAPVTLPEPTLLSEGDRDDLIEDFTDSLEVERLTDPTNPIFATLDEDEADDVLADNDGTIHDAVREVAGVFVDYADSRLQGDPLRVSPQAMELFMLAWVPYRAFLSASSSRWLPHVLEAWVDYALRVRPGGGPEPVHDAIRACTPAYVDAMASDEASASRLRLATAFMEEHGFPS
jgi:hypothetical protein